ncbi:MAG TPA: MDR family MFS transporter [Ktedonobacterales bacterium]|nr:MDR family MFS transporter [Ktedonobacterales bacterium]
MAQSLTAKSAIPAGVTPGEDEVAHLDLKQLIPVLIGLMLGMLLAALDQTVVGTAMPHVVASLGGQNNLSWVYTAYLLASTVGVPIYGKLSDIYGRRIFFLGGMVVFLAGSALSGASQNMTELIAFRAIQGLGAGALMPIAQAAIGDIFPPAERGKWQGLFVSVFGLATIVGPLLGGWLTDNGPVLGSLVTDTTRWRWVFYVNMPVGALALITAGLTLPRQFHRRRHVIDYIGSTLLIVWAVPLLLAVSLGGQTYAWGSWQIISLFAVAAAGLIAFLFAEFRATEPIINPRLFKNSIFTVSTMTMFLVSAGMFGAILFLPYFTQDVLNETATNSGVVLTPMMLGFMFSSIVGGQLLSRTGRYKIIALVGFAVATAGMFLLSQMTVNTSNGELVRNMVITGLGIGVMMSLFTIVVQNAFPLSKIGEVTASLSFFRSMGATIGLAVLGSVLTNTLPTNIENNLPAALKKIIPSSQISSGLGNPSSGGGSSLQQAFAKFGPEGQILYQQFEHAIRVGLAQSLTEMFFIGAVIMAFGFMLTLFLREIPLRKGRGPAESAPQAAQDIAEVAPVEPVLMD